MLIVTHSVLSGWAYNELTATTSAVDLALDVLDTFLSSVQDYGFHATPKTLALVDTAGYPAFRDAWDALCSAMADIIASGDDADFHASLMRARGNTLSFEGVLDFPSNEISAAMDIGDFFENLFQLCNPDESSELFMLMVNASNAYSEMFVSSGVGPGTTRKASGMHITWVSKQAFLDSPQFYEPAVFPSTSSSPLIGAPNYQRFLRWFYYSSTPTENFGPSVCGTSSKSSRSPTSPSELLIDPAIVFVDAINTEVRSEITRNVDLVSVEYGIDVTYLLQDTDVRRRLDESARRQQARRLEGDKPPRSAFAGRRDAMKWRYRENSDRTQGPQGDEVLGTEDYYLIYGGDVAVEYNGSNVVAYWDSTFYWIQSGDVLEPVYAFDNGEDLKSIPVCYFDQNNPVTSVQLSLGVTVDEAIQDLGCEFGFLSFSAAEDSDGKVTLYVYRGNKLSEVSLATGRNIVPISYIEYSVGDLYVDELLGGFNSVVVPWTLESNFTFFSLSDAANLEAFGSDVAFLQIFAYDEDSNVTDAYIMPYTFGGNATGFENRRHLLALDPTAVAPDSFSFALPMGDDSAEDLHW